MPRQLTIELLGDSSRAEQAFRNVGSASDKMATDVKDNSDKTHKSLNDVGEGFDTGEQRIIGFRDAITGTGDIMRGFRDGDIVSILTGFADLASSVVNFVVPALGRLGAMLGLSTGATNAAAAANTGFGASLTAALGPIALVVAAIAGIIAIGVLVVKNWDTIKDAASATWGWIRDRWGDLLEFFKGIPGKISALAVGMWDGLKEAFRSALNWIIDRWNGLEFKVPGFKIGPVGYEGFTLGMPDIPRLAGGGITMGPTLAVVGDNPGGREAIVPLTGPAAAAAGVGGRTYQLTVYALDPRSAAETVVRAIDEYEARNGSRYARA